MISLLLTLVDPAVAALPPAPALSSVTAEDDERARELFQNGLDLYEEGRYEDAIAAWEEAWRLSGRPLLLFNMANAAERIARWDDAMELLSRYRAFAPSDERETLDRRIANIQRRIEETRGATGSTTTTTSTTAQTTTTPSTTPGPTRSVSPLPIVLLSAGGASVVTGTIFGVRALDARADAADSCASSGDATYCTGEARDALARDRSSALVADLTIGLGALAVAGGVVTLIVPLPLQVGGSVGPGGGMLSVGGTFR